MSNEQTHEIGLFEKIAVIYPELNDVKKFNEYIELRDDSDGNGPYIAKWEHPDYVQPTQEQLDAVLEPLPTPYDQLRAEAYPSIADQLDMIYWDKVNGTNQWQQAITTVKVTYPKDN